MNITSAEHHTPVASYIPMGVHDTAVPMGKYYPTNYESRMSRTQPPMRHSSSTSSVSSTRSISVLHEQQQQQQHQTHLPHQIRSESDAKSRLQQYQRDMTAQTRMVAGAATGAISSNRTSTPSTLSSAPRNLFPYGNTMVIGASIMAATPVSPRLHPLGSPGPVTPMNLEESKGDYLSKGQTPPSRPSSVSYEHNRIRR